MHIGHIVSYILIFNYYTIPPASSGFKHGCKDSWLSAAHGSHSLAVTQHAFGSNEMCCGSGDGVKRCGVA